MSSGSGLRMAGERMVFSRVGLSKKGHIREESCCSCGRTRSFVSDNEGRNQSTPCLLAWQEHESAFGRRSVAYQAVEQVAGFGAMLPPGQCFRPHPLRLSGDYDGSDGSCEATVVDGTVTLTGRHAPFLGFAAGRVIGPAEIRLRTRSESGLPGKLSGFHPPGRRCRGGNLSCPAGLEGGRQAPGGWTARNSTRLSARPEATRGNRLDRTPPREGAAPAVGFRQRQPPVATSTQPPPVHHRVGRNCAPNSSTNPKKHSKTASFKKGTQPSRFAARPARRFTACLTGRAG